MSGIVVYYNLRVVKQLSDMREWLRGGVQPCQGWGRGFESRLALFLLQKTLVFMRGSAVCIANLTAVKIE